MILTSLGALSVHAKLLHVTAHSTTSILSRNLFPQDKLHVFHYHHIYGNSFLLVDPSYSFCCFLSENIRKNGRWRSPKAAVIPNFHLPMRSFEVKNRTSIEDINKLRLITAIKTPYLPDGRFDLEAYDALMHMQIVNGAEGVIVGGTTGEGHLMSWDEHIMLIGHTVNCFGGSIKVIGNTGSNSTREAIHASEQGFAVGMHAALHINPYYGKTSLQGMVSHFENVLSMGPTIIYNVPSRTGQDIPPSVINTLAQNINLAGVKECMGNDRIKEYTEKGMVIWSGNDDQCHDARWAYGACGVISVTSNLVPGLVHELMFGGKNATLNSKLMPLIEWLFHEPNPIALNTALAQLGVVRPVFRLPYVPLPLSRRVEFVQIVKDLGRENFVGEKDVQILDDDDFMLVGRY
ncbi:4-hydroxy-tetrahydrodipicolinate synthase, chloroplastic-like isoform X2 [Magnolia sinica]|uniref:4-hydroxy-tetrahydrodipicolinate synthase, chloroplastic-like isoform X2 n=1 Tax=Magnolia sinica TaxID=86752 RepID=UPI00265AFF75|nr:4-hydroxy-tetrahydrodipicolinate synthase, chloroplastic-like isoform X2 [Magnolia sinica]